MLGAQLMVQLLQMATPLLACCSGLLATLAVSGNSWLLTDERFTNPGFSNGSSRVQYQHKKTVSGLFLLCQTDVGSDSYSCSNIDYFSQDLYRPDPHDSTLAIPYTVVRSSPFFLSGLVVLAVAEMLCVLGHFRRHSSRVITFVAGVTFIMQGLLMMMGCVMYIATLKGEVWQKLRPKSTYSPAPFRYSYGHNFVLVVTSFTISELTGFCSIMLFIYWYKRDWKRSQKGTPSETSSSHPSCHHSLLNSCSAPPTPSHLLTSPSPLSWSQVLPYRSGSGHPQSLYSTHPHTEYAANSHLPLYWGPSTVLSGVCCHAAALLHAPPPPPSSDRCQSSKAGSSDEAAGIIDAMEEDDPAANNATSPRKRSLAGPQSLKCSGQQLSDSRSPACLQDGLTQRSKGDHLLQFVESDARETEDSDYANLSLISELSSGRFEPKFEMSVITKENTRSSHNLDPSTDESKIWREGSSSSDSSTEENASQTNMNASLQRFQQQCLGYNGLQLRLHGYPVECRAADDSYSSRVGGGCLTSLPYEQHADTADSARTVSSIADPSLPACRVCAAYTAQYSGLHSACCCVQCCQKIMESSNMNIGSLQKQSRIN